MQKIEAEDYAKLQEMMSKLRSKDERCKAFKDEKNSSMEQDLVLTDQLKRRVLRDVKEYFRRYLGDIKSSSELVRKLDDYEIAR
ncbi:hypothetical protein TNCT_606591, partial [Trichonephila clavata]